MNEQDKQFMNRLDLTLRSPDVRFSVEMEELFNVQLRILKRVWEFEFASVVVERYIKADVPGNREKEYMLSQYISSGKAYIESFEIAVQYLITTLQNDFTLVFNPEFEKVTTALQSHMQSVIVKGQAINLTLAKQLLSGCQRTDN